MRYVSVRVATHWRNENRTFSFVSPTLCNVRRISHVLFIDKCLLYKLIVLLLLSHKMGRTRGNATLVLMLIYNDALTIPTANRSQLSINLCLI